MLIDYRSIHLLAEHKEGLYRRLKYVISRFKLEGETSGLLAKYEAISKEMQAVRIKFMELGMAKDISLISAKSTIKQLIEVLAGVKQKEQAILEELIPILEAKLS